MRFFKKVIFFPLLLSLFVSSGLHAQTMQVKGDVIGVNGQPIAGVVVMTKGSSNGTATDPNGHYSINVPNAKSVLTFSFLGYTTQEIVVGTRKEINITLTEDQISLEELVVIGYGTMRKRDVTGAISSINASTIEERAPVNVFDALQGQAAGVQIISGSGSPGSSTDIRIRGTSTFGDGYKPLYIVDGVQYESIDDINPSDIQSIEVLKDAASSAIYGSKSANGVILVTTKVGNKDKPRVDLRYLHSIGQLSRTLPRANMAEREYYDQTRYRLSGRGIIFPDSLSNFANSDSDLQDLLVRTSQRDQIDLSVSGGTSNLKYFMSAGFLNEKGVVINSRYRRITSRINVDYKASKRLTFGNKAQFLVSDMKGTDEQGVLNEMLLRPAYYSIFESDGSLTEVVAGRRNPLAIALNEVNQTQKYTITDYLYGEYAFTPDFKFRTSLQGSMNLDKYQFYRPSTQYQPGSIVPGIDNTTLYYNYTNENILTYNKNIKNHNITVMAGNSIQRWVAEKGYMKGQDFTTDEIYTLNSASAYDLKNTYTSVSNHSMASFFGRLSYSYKGRYLFNGNIRADGSSRFGAENRWGYFPSASFGWRFSDEAFMKWSKNVLGDAKLRLSYGITGNEAIGDYDRLMVYTPNNFYDGVSGIAPSRLPDEFLGWESTEQYNVGADFAMFNNRLRIVADYYLKNTTDLLYNVQVPKESGFNTVRRNIGSMRNKGFELTIEGDIIRKRDINWSASFNISSNISSIVKLADGAPFYAGIDDATYVQENHKIGEFYGYKYLGIFAYDESNAFSESWRRLTPVFTNSSFDHYTLDGQPYTGTINQKKDMSNNVLKGGDVDFYDSNSDGVVDIKDKVYLGCAQPTVYGGVSTNINYKSFTLLVNFYYSLGGKIYNSGEATRNSAQYDGYTPTPEFIHNMWTQPGDIAKYPAPIVSDNNRSYPSSLYIEDASYIKLRNVRLTYVLPSKYLKKMPIKGLSAYIYGNNLLTFSSFKGYDPEFSTTNALALGIYTYRYPRKREFGMGVNINF